MAVAGTHTLGLAVVDEVAARAVRADAGALRGGKSESERGGEGKRDRDREREEEDKDENENEMRRDLSRKRRKKGEHSKTLLLQAGRKNNNSSPVERAAHLRLVLRVARKGAQLVGAVRKLQKGLRTCEHAMPK